MAGSPWVVWPVLLTDSGTLCQVSPQGGGVACLPGTSCLHGGRTQLPACGVSADGDGFPSWPSHLGGCGQGLAEAPGVQSGRQSIRRHISKTRTLFLKFFIFFKAPRW